MRSGTVLVTLALLIGAAPAWADESVPYPLEVKKSAVKHPRAKLAARKPAARKAAVANRAAPKVVTPKTATANTEPAQDVFAGIPLGERQKIQAALLWSGDYTGAVNGEDPMLTAIKNFQKRSKGKVTGVLTPGERANLIAAAQNHEQDFGWNVVVDPATGIRIGLPTKMVPNARESARGTRWSSAHGEVQVETFRITDPDLKLAALFEQQKKEPGTRRVEYSVLRDDNFFISGLQGLKKFSVRAQLRNGEVRGAGEIGRIRQRAGGERARPHRHRPQAHRRLPGDRGFGTGRCRAHRRRRGQRAGAVARLWPAQGLSAGAAARCAQVRRTDADRHSRSEGTERQPHAH